MYVCMCIYICICIHTIYHASNIVETPADSHVCHAFYPLFKFRFNIKNNHTYAIAISRISFPGRVHDQAHLQFCPVSYIHTQEQAIHTYNIRVHMHLHASIH